MLFNIRDSRRPPWTTGLSCWMRPRAQVHHHRQYHRGRSGGGPHPESTGRSGSGDRNQRRRGGRAGNPAARCANSPEERRSLI